MLGGEERLRGRPGGTSARSGRPAQTPASPLAGRPLRKSFAGVLCGGMAGFLLGAAFWVVLGLQELTGSGAPESSPARGSQGAPAAAPDCTSLALDRRWGHTTAEPCLRQALPQREAHATALGDRSLP